MNRPIAKIQQELTNVQTKIVVEVKLAGFDGGDSGGENGVMIKSDSLSRHLDSLQRDLESVVLQPELKHMVRCMHAHACTSAHAYTTKVQFLNTFMHSCFQGLIFACLTPLMHMTATRMCV